jgi:hypothetical protein
MAQKKNPPGKKPKTENEDKDLETTETQDDEDTEDEDNEDDAEAENRRINAIVTSRVKREMKAVNTQLQALMSKLESMSTPSKKEETEDEDEDTTTEDKKTQVDPKLSKKMTKLERELAEEKAARKKAEEERTAEQERGKKQEMRNVFSSALTELGVTDPKLLRAAINMLDEDGVMIRDEDGKIKFKGQDKYGIETNFLIPKQVLRPGLQVMVSRLFPLSKLADRAPVEHEVLETVRLHLPHEISRSLLRSN